MTKNTIQIRIDPGAGVLLDRLHHAGYQAYAVGGCVRDALLGRTPNDWDICTDARPEQVIQLFGSRRCIPTGMKHGTVSVKQSGGLYEVTTFRTEGAYSDSRHPDSVTFIRNVEDDLARRDFTVNAMAYSRESGLVDPFGGYEDLTEHHLIRAVGEPEERFREDALRILRLYRFAARFRLSIDPATAAAAVLLAGNLRVVSAERIREELVKLLMANAPSAYLEPAVTSVFLPDLYAGRYWGKASETDVPGVAETPAAENAAWRDAMDHTLRRIDRIRAEEPLRIAALLQDISVLSGNRGFRAEDGKASVPGVREDTAGEESAKNLLGSLRCSNEQISCVCSLVRFHDLTPAADEAGQRVQVRYLLNRLGPKRVRLLLELCLADAETGRERDAGRIRRLSGLGCIMENLLLSEACYSLKQLAVTGADLMETFGIPRGPRVGKILSHLLDLVLSEKLPNDKAVLLSEAENAGIS